MDREEKIEKIQALVRHIENVKENCHRLGMKLTEQENNFELGKRLIANSYLHDNSKFFSIEWQHLTNTDKDDEMLDVVIGVHNTQNFHHPECWNGIKEMPEVFLAELCCDWFARSNELGKDLKEWIDTTATKRWKFTKRDKVYKKIMYFVNLLIEKGL